MLKRSVQNVKVEDYRNVRSWVDIEEIAPVMVRAILASEDGKFMEHNGFDLQELRKMRREHILPKTNKSLYINQLNKQG